MPPASSRAPDLSRAVDAVLERGLAKDPGDRWDSSPQFVDGAAAHAGHAPGAARRPAAVRRRRAARSHAAGRPSSPGRTDRPRRRDAAPASGLPDRRRARATRPRPWPRADRAPPPRPGAAPLLAGLAGLALIAVIATIALAIRGDDDPRHPARARTRRRPTASRGEDQGAEAHRDRLAGADGYARADSDGAGHRAASGGPERPTSSRPRAPARRLQRAPRATARPRCTRRARPAACGDSTALAKAREASARCGNAQVGPCGDAISIRAPRWSRSDQPARRSRSCSARLDAPTRIGELGRALKGPSRRRKARTPPSCSHPSLRCHATRPRPRPRASVRRRRADGARGAARHPAAQLRRPRRVEAPRTALALLRREPRDFAVVVSDMRMPEMAGAVFLREARRAPRSPCGSC